MAGTIMSTDPQSLLRLMTWLSPAFPTGGFSYSHGLESAIYHELIKDRECLKNWISRLITNGSLWNDCVLLCDAYDAEDDDEVRRCCELAEALAGSKERHLETMKQGAAFLKAVVEWSDFELPDTAALPVAVGIVAKANSIKKHETLIAFLQAFTTNQIQAALRLMSLGQANGLWVQRELEETILNVANKASNSTIADLGSNTIHAEIAAMRHETMHSRIFRS